MDFDLELGRARSEDDAWAAIQVYGPVLADLDYELSQSTTIDAQKEAAARLSVVCREMAFLFAELREYRQSVMLMEKSKLRSYFDFDILQFFIQNDSNLASSRPVHEALDRLEQAERAFRITSKADDDYHRAAGEIRVAALGQLKSAMPQPVEPGLTVSLDQFRLYAADQMTRRTGALMHISICHYGLLCVIAHPLDQSTIRRHCFVNRWPYERMLGQFESVGRMAGQGATDFMLVKSGSWLDIANYLTMSDPESHVGTDMLSMLESGLADVGESIAAPIHDFLTDLQLEEVAVVVGGDLQQIPFHLAPFLDETTDSVTSIAEQLPWRVLPSAALALVFSGGESLPPSIQRCVVFTEGAGEEIDEELVRGGLPECSIDLLNLRNAESPLAGRADLVHFSGHGYVPQSAGLEAAIVAGDGTSALTVEEMLNAHPPLFDGGVIVAATCQSGYASGDNVDEAISIATGLLASGGSGVVGSYWSIDEVATSIFLSMFYENLGRGLEPWKAVHETYRRMINAPLDEILSYCQERPLLLEHVGGADGVRSIYFGLEESDERWTYHSKGSGGRSPLLSGSDSEQGPRLWMATGFTYFG